MLGPLCKKPNQEKEWSNLKTYLCLTQPFWIGGFPSWHVWCVLGTHQEPHWLPSRCLSGAGSCACTHCPHSQRRTSYISISTASMGDTAALLRAAVPLPSLVRQDEQAPDGPSDSHWSCGYRSRERGDPDRTWQLEIPSTPG